MGWDPWSTSAHAQVRQLHLICLRHGPGHASKTSWASTAMTCQAELVLLQIARCPNDLTTEICSVSQQLPVLPTMRRCLHCNANCTCTATQTVLAQLDRAQSPPPVKIPRQ